MEFGIGQLAESVLQVAEIPGERRRELSVIVVALRI